MKYLLIILTCLVALPACGKKNPVETNPTQPDYFPVSTGSWWKYSSFWGQMDSIGMMDTLVNGQIVYKTFTIVFGDTHTSYIYKSAKEIRKYLFLSDTSFYTTIMKLPLYVGSKWQNRTWGVIYDSSYVVGMMTTGVPAGSFNSCFHVLKKWHPVNEEPSEANSWYAPGVGLVLTVDWDTTKLTSYSIK